MQSYLDDGWEHKSLQRGRKSPTKGLIWINKDNEHKCVIEDELQSYLDDGWELGRNVTPTKNKISIKKGGQSKYVFESELQSYLDDGWRLGSTTRNKGKVTVYDPTQNKFIQTDANDPRYLSGELKLKLQMIDPHAKGTKYINKDGILKRIKPELLQQYLDDGWELGMKKKNKL